MTITDPRDVAVTDDVPVRRARSDSDAVRISSNAQWFAAACAAVVYEPARLVRVMLGEGRRPTSYLASEAANVATLRLGEYVRGLMAGSATLVTGSVRFLSAKSGPSLEKYLDFTLGGEPPAETFTAVTSFPYGAAEERRDLIDPLRGGNGTSNGHSKRTEMTWVSANKKELLRSYPGRWIAVLDDQVVSSSTSLRKLSDACIELAKTGSLPRAPFIAHVTPKRATRRELSTWHR